MLVTGLPLTGDFMIVKKIFSRWFLLNLTIYVTITVDAGKWRIFAEKIPQK